MNTLRIDIWSDIACPWCWVGKRRLEAALERFPHRDQVAIVWRAFELDPGAPREATSPVSYAERIAKKYGSSVQNAQARIDEMTATALADGLEFRFDRIRPGNTFDAHRVLHLALDRGVQDAVKERLLRGYLGEGASMSDHPTLARLAGEAGLDAVEVSATLAGDAHANEVRADEREAAELGIQGVPFFVLDGRLAVSGAQPSELFQRALEQAWRELTRRPTVVAADGQSTVSDPAGAAAAEVCGPEGCDVAIPRA